MVIKNQWLKYSFFPSTIPVWNALPACVLSSQRSSRAFLLCRNRFWFWPGFGNCPFIEWKFLETETGFLIYFAETKTSFWNYWNHLQREFRRFRLSEDRCSQKKKMAASEWHMLLKLTINVHYDRERAQSVQTRITINETDPLYINKMWKSILLLFLLYYCEGSSGYLRWPILGCR